MFLQELLEVLQNDTAGLKIKAGRPSTPLKDMLLLTIWTLATAESFRSIGDRFNINKGHAYKLVLKICNMLSSIAKHVISWPKTDAQFMKNVSEFNNLREIKNFPSVIGCVGCTHIKILGFENDNSYYNHKGYHSVLLQAICNAKQEFINVFCGWPGSYTDAQVWANCEIFKNIQNDSLKLPPKTYLLGDSGYPLSRNLIVPFCNNDHLSRKQRRFNQILSNCHMVIEQAFDMLKGQFRRLKCIESTKISVINSEILACCVLHNISIRGGIKYAESEDDLEIDVTQDDYDFRNKLMNEIIK